LRRKNKRRLIIDLDSTEDPVRGKQEQLGENGKEKQVTTFLSERGKQ